MITRRSLADTIDAYDEQIADLNKSKRETFDAYRDQMVAARLTKPEIKAEIEAVKAAIKRRRESVKDEHALIEKDELIDEVFHEITRAPRATRENIEKFDAETGEILDGEANAKLVATVATGMQTEIGRKALVAALDIMIDREEEEERRSDNGLNIQTKHTDIRSGGPSAAPVGLTTRPAEESVVPHSPETATQSLANGPCEAVSERTAIQVDASASAEAGVSGQPEMIPATSAKSAGEAAGNASDLPTNSDQPLTGGDHEVASIAERERETVTSNTGEGAAKTALPEPDQFIEDVPPTPMKRLHYAHCFPELTKAEYGRLEFSIIGIGVSKPIIRMGDVIVDGWARYNICRTLGISYPIQNYSGNDVLLDVIELQRASRNFTPAQEKKIAADLAKEIPHRADDIMAAFGLAEAMEAAE